MTPISRGHGLVVSRVWGLLLLGLFLLRLYRRVSPSPGGCVSYRDLRGCVPKDRTWLDPQPHQDLLPVSTPGCGHP